MNDAEIRDETLLTKIIQASVSSAELKKSRDIFFFSRITSTHRVSFFPCDIQEKGVERTDGQIYRQTDGHIDRQTYRQTDI